MIALFAALIAPWFINWDDYKANFEAEASRILGQPVHVLGSADASILPSPSLTFTDVQVGETEGQPMMTVKRFSVTIELMPLIEGQIRVIAMQLEEPVVRVAVDDSGQVDWLIRGEVSRDLNPDNVVLNGVEIQNGTLVYDDATSGASVKLTDINATVDARSLAGPWRVEGSYKNSGTPSQFQVTTGRRLEDGTLRVKADITPGQWPIAIGADGILAHGEDGPTYSGTYSLTQVLLAEAQDGEGRGDVTGWRSEGSFKLTRDQLTVDKAVLSEGPPDRPSSLAGSMTLTLGSSSRFFATVQARQLDLDRSLGEGPKKPIEMATAANEFVRWLRGIPVPGIAGTVRFNVPAIVVGGAVIQDVSFAASPADNGWYIEGLKARLPGSSTFAADGNLITGDKISFGGNVRLAVNQPATFAAWWRGKGEAGTGRLLSPFELTSEQATVTMDSLRVERMTTRIGDATITGSFSWSSGAPGTPGTLTTDLQADRLDFVQVRALADLLGGRDLGDASSLADAYSIKLAADELTLEDLRMRGVAADAGFADGTLTVNAIRIADIGGAKIEVKKGTIADLFSHPVGAIRADITAPTLDGLTNLATRLAPDSAATEWFRRAAPSLAPVSLTVEIDSQPVDERTESLLKIYGDLAATKAELSIGMHGPPAAWRTGDLDLAASLTSHDAVGLARQIGPVASGVAIEGGARFDLKASGSPATGLVTSLDVKFGSLKAAASGTATLPAEGAPGFAGTVELAEQDIAPLLRLLDVDIPGVGETLPVSIKAETTTAGRSGDVKWSNAAIADRTVSGAIRIAERPDGGLGLDSGSLDIDMVDLGWVASLGLGYAPAPTGNPEEPWPTTPFGEATTGLAAELDIAAERLVVGNTLQVRNGKVHLGLGRDRVDFDVKSGDALGGIVAGGFSVRNVGGNASLTGNLSLVGGTLDAIIWQRAGRPVANGTLDLSANFEATGRSPAGMVASLTGGGTVAIHDGEARYLNPKAAVLVIRDSDLGQEFTEDALKDIFGRYIDNGNLTFPEVEAPFAIAAGTVRFQNITVDAAETRASGSAAIDLNTLTLDSDWTLTLDDGDDRFGGDIPPQAGIVFRGPLGVPERIIDVLQFNSYLAIRQEARLQEVLALEEQARLENAFFNRVKRKLREDEERAARLAEEARQARITSATNLEALHATREIAAEKRAEDELIAWWAIAEQAAADKAAAMQAAADADAAARTARLASDEAAARAAALAESAQQAGDAVAAASAIADRAAAARRTAEADVAGATAARDEAAAGLERATAAVDAAKAALDAAKDAAANAETEVGAAAAKSDAADRQAEATAAIAEDARAVADAAAADAASLAATLAGLEAELAAANAALDTAHVEATAAGQLSDALERKADDAASRIAAGKPEVKAANDAAKAADDARSVAEGALAQAEAMLLAARKAHAEAMADLDAKRGTGEAEAAEAELRAKAAALTAAEDAVTDARATLADASAAADDAREKAETKAQALRAIEMEASAATTAAAGAAEKAKAADAAVIAQTAARDDLAAQVETARKAADKAATVVTRKDAEADAAEADAAAARAAANLAASESATAVTAREDAAAAIATATAALAAAEADAKSAEAALAEAEGKVETANAALAAAVQAADAAQAAFDAAIGVGNQALAEQKAAEDAAAEALRAALAAEATAREAAASAAAMPPGWRAGQRGGERAAELPPPDAAPIAAEPASLVTEPEAPINLIPVTPRLRPQRPSDPPRPAASDLMPTADQPLTIVQP